MNWVEHLPRCQLNDATVRPRVGVLWAWPQDFESRGRKVLFTVMFNRFTSLEAWYGFRLALAYAGLDHGSNLRTGI
jgi:hypothetical protein